MTAHSRGIVSAIGLAFLVAWGIPSSSRASLGQLASPPAAVAPVTIKTAADCQALSLGHGLESFPLTVDDDGRSYEMAPCQAVWAQLLHPAHDGCQWTTVESSDARILAILPVPLPPPPDGGTSEIYEPTSLGRAQLSSSLSCSTSGEQARWSVTIEVTR